jgi:hypothetical protein
VSPARENRTAQRATDRGRPKDWNRAGRFRGEGRAGPVGRYPVREDGRNVLAFFHVAAAMIPLP